MPVIASFLGPWGAGSTRAHWQPFQYAEQLYPADIEMIFWSGLKVFQDVLTDGETNFRLRQKKFFVMYFPHMPPRHILLYAPGQPSWACNRSGCISIEHAWQCQTWPMQWWRLSSTGMPLPATPSTDCDSAISELCLLRPMFV